MKKLLSRGLVALAILALPILALAPAALATDAKPFISEQSNSDDSALVYFGNNTLFAANSGSDQSTAKGLGFSVGNQLEVLGNSEYGFVAGNIVTYAGHTDKDLFAAGNLIELKSDAKIGRDVFLAGNQITIAANLPGNLAATASRISFENTTILGDVNLSAAELIFGENVKIVGTLEYNDDAIVTGLDQATIGATSTYHLNSSASTTTQDFWTQTGFSIIGSFITALLLIVIFAGLKDRIATEATVQRFGANLVNGIVFLIAGPILSLLLILTVFGMTSGLLLLGAWVIILCLAGAIAGIYLGHLICTKFLRCHLPFIIEALTGVVVLKVLALIPVVGNFISLLAVLLGSGLIVSCLRRTSSDSTSVPQPSTNLENPFRGQSKAAPTKKSSPKASSTKTTRTTRKTTKQK